jgi:hypothetical protein
LPLVGLIGVTSALAQPLGMLEYGIRQKVRLPGLAFEAEGRSRH